MTRPGVPATRTSDGRGAGNCWPAKSKRVYARGGVERKSRRQQNACSTWPHNINEVPERTDTTIDAPESELFRKIGVFGPIIDISCAVNSLSRPAVAGGCPSADRSCSPFPKSVRARLKG